MKKALILIHDDPNFKPIVIMETDKNGVFKHYSANPDVDKFEDAWYEKNAKSEKNTLEMVAHGYSMYAQQIVKYDGEGKVEVDNVLKQLGFSKP
jgi:hypothetical protein